MEACFVTCALYDVADCVFRRKEACVMVMSQLDLALLNDLVSIDLKKRLQAVEADVLHCQLLDLRNDPS